MTNVPERGSSAACPFCAVKARNEHSIKQSGECDGIRTNQITGDTALRIRLRNSGKQRKQDTN